MKISRFIHVLDDSTLWDSLNKKSISLDKYLVEYIKENKYNVNLSNYPKILEDTGIVVTVESEKQLIEKLVKQTTDNQFQGLYLITTTSCNLDCDYCFYRSSASGSLKHREFMEFEIAKMAIDEFKKVVDNNIKTDGYWQQITFYGGEPMLNKKLLMEAIPYARKVFNDCWTDLVINTNLTILDDDLIKLFKDNKVIIEVSIDGNRNLHDLHRKTIDGKGSYDVVIKNAKTLVKNNIEILPMITATNDNVNDFCDIVSEVLQEIGVDKFNANILITDSYNINEDYCENLAQQMIMLNERFAKKENAGAYGFKELCDSLIGKNKLVAKNSCGATRKITVFPNGNVYACQALEKLDLNNMGTLENDFVNNEKWELWKKRNKFLNEECLDCEIIASCGGGCATGSYNYSGTIYGKDYNQCMYNKALFKLLKRKI